MLKRFEVTNYRNFKENIIIDFGEVGGYQFSQNCIRQGLISKMLIYGRNATGKTNLGRAIMNISTTLLGRPALERDNFQNADSKEELVRFKYEFAFGEKKIEYNYSKKTVYKLEKEQLRVDGISIFECDYENKTYSFSGLDKIGAETVNVERYTEYLYESDEHSDEEEAKIPFLRWLINNAALNSDSVILELFDYVKRMSMMVNNNFYNSPFRRMNDIFFKALEEGDNLEKFERFLNLMGIECELVLEILPDDQRELYFRHDKKVRFFDNASSGTLMLVNLYRRMILPLQKPSFIFMDEFDAYYHYEMAEMVVRFLQEEYPNTQVVLTSHNTNLMTNQLMRPDCLLILSGEGKLTPLAKATKRELREGHNLEKLYISGEFKEYE